MLATTVEELRSVALAAADASGYFPAMYARVTERIQIAAGSGRFDDPERMERFAATFASWYLRARSGGAAVPACWRAAFDVADDSHLMIVQNLLLGINAHVNFDLPQVVVELAPDGGDLGALRADYDGVNDILSETLPDVLASLGAVSRWVNVVAARGGGRLFDFSLEVARAQAWRAAVRLHGLPEAERRIDVAELDRVVAVLAHLVARPGRPASWLVAGLRLLERNDPADVTRRLLGHLA